MTYNNWSIPLFTTPTDLSAGALQRGGVAVDLEDVGADLLGVLRRRVVAARALVRRARVVAVKWTQSTEGRCEGEFTFSFVC